MTSNSQTNPSNRSELDADGLDVIEALVADAVAVEGVANVHEGSSYFADRVIRRAVEQGTLVVLGPENHPASIRTTTQEASTDVVERAVASLRQRFAIWREVTRLALTAQERFDIEREVETLITAIRGGSA